MLYKIMQWTRYDGNAPPRVLDVVEDPEYAQSLVLRFDEYYPQFFHTVREIEWSS